MTDPRRPLRLLEGPSNTTLQPGSSHALSWPDPRWSPLRRAVFDLYRRHRISEGATSPCWAVTYDTQESGRLRSVGTDFDARHIFLIAEIGSNPSMRHRFEFAPDDLARGADNIAPILRDYLRTDEVKLAQDRIFRFWLTMTGHAQAAILAAAVALYARLGSTVADFTRVPPDTFAHYKVTDWLRGVAESSLGPPLLSPHLDLEIAGPFFGQPSVTGTNYVAQQEARAGKRPSRILDFTIEYLRGRYPNGPPPGMSHKMLAREASKEHARQFSMPHNVSRETIRKAFLALHANNEH